LAFSFNLRHDNLVSTEFGPTEIKNDLHPDWRRFKYKSGKGWQGLPLLTST
jgi:hypothetical protein